MLISKLLSEMCPKAPNIMLLLFSYTIIAHDIVMGSSSLIVIWIIAQYSGHWNWNHSPWNEYALHLQLPEASKMMIAPGFVLQGANILLTPFHLGRNKAHYTRSKQNKAIRRNVMMKLFSSDWECNHVMQKHPTTSNHLTCMLELSDQWDELLLGVIP